MRDYSPLAGTYLPLLGALRTVSLRPCATGSHSPKPHGRLRGGSRTVPFPLNS